MIGKRSWSQKRKLEGEKKHFHTDNFVLQADVAVAQLVERPELRSLEKVQLCWREFDSRCRDGRKKDRGKKVIQTFHLSKLG